MRESLYVGGSNRWMSIIITSYVSYRGEGRCQYAHERFSVCHYHYVEKHPGRWQDCEECRRDLGVATFMMAFTDGTNVPRY